MKKKTLVIVAILLMIIGFAAVSTTLFINGQVNVGANIKNFDIYFSEAIVDGEDVSNEVIDSTKKIITYETKTLSLKDETSVLDFEVTNNSTQYDADVKITCTIDQTSTYKNLVTVTTDQPSYVIPAQTRKNGSVTVTLKDTYVETTPAQVTFECELVAEAKSLNALVADAIDDTTTYDLEGILKDKDGNILPKTDMVVYSNTPHVVKTDRNGYFYVSGLEKGRHEIYLKTDADINDKEATASASSFGATITTNKVYKVTKGEYVIDSYNIGTEIEDRSSYCEYEVGKTWDFDYTGNYEEFKIQDDCDGTYKIELWGAQGGSATSGSRSDTLGGYGGYTSGTIYLSSLNNLYLYLGGAGSDKHNNPDKTGGWNGGGSVRYNTSSYSGGADCTGGGSTDVRIVSGAWNDSDSLRSRIMVAGAGGGASDEYNVYWYSNGGSAGGLTGNIPTMSYMNNNGSTVKNIYYSFGGSQTEGGKATSYSSSRGDPQNGGFGYGGYGTYNDEGSGGGAGWYGGGGTNVDGGAGGGSSYISGHIGSVAVSSITSSVPKSGCTTGTTNQLCSITPYINSATNEEYKFTDTVMIDGAGYNWTNTKGSYVGQPQPNGTTAAGHSGNGYARITLVSLD